MNEELVKNLLRLKISFAHRVAEGLPESVQKPIKELEKQTMQVLYDISREYVEKASADENAKQAGGVKSIEVL